MTDDLVKRLRDAGDGGAAGPTTIAFLLAEAADRIATLSAWLRALTAAGRAIQESRWWTQTAVRQIAHVHEAEMVALDDALRLVDSALVGGGEGETP